MPHDKFWAFVLRWALEDDEKLSEKNFNYTLISLDYAEKFNWTVSGNELHFQRIIKIFVNSLERFMRVKLKLKLTKKFYWNF